MTMQVPERLHFDGHEYDVGAEPLRPYLQMSHARVGRDDVRSSACWRGYWATWEVRGSRLYLTNIADVMGETAPLSEIFQAAKEAVFAHWFSGTIRLPRAEHASDTRTRVLTFSRGVLTGEDENGGYFIPVQPREAGERPLAVHLVEKLDVSEIEATARVSDPLGFVPSEPFGHLNPTWEAFKSAIPLRCSLWRFEQEWKGAELHSGYAAVRRTIWTLGRRKITHFILSDIRHI